MKRFVERGFTLVEIMIVVAIIALLAAIAIPNVLRGRTTANESAAIGNLRALMSSLEMERSVNNTYPTTAAGSEWGNAMYGTSCTGAAGDTVNPDFGPPSFCLVGAVNLTATLVQGYNYTFTAGPAAGQTYNLIAVPATPGTTGTRSFYVNETGVIRHCREPGGAAAGTVANGRLPAAGWVTIDAVLPAGNCT